VIRLKFVTARSTSPELAVFVLENELVQAVLEHFKPSQLRLRGEQAQAATSHYFIYNGGLGKGKVGT
jgi:hypothetical protein